MNPNINCIPKNMKNCILKEVFKMKNTKNAESGHNKWILQNPIKSTKDKKDFFFEF